MHEKLQEDLKNALKAKDEIRLLVIRNIKAALTNELVATGHKPTDSLSDEEILKVIARLAKQRKDSIEQFRSGGREDLAEKEEAELVILEEYLPAQMSDEELKALIEEVKSKQGITDKSGIGKLIGLVMRETQGRADGVRVKALVEDLFN